MPDRLPSLIILVGCWVPAAMAGRAAAELAHRRIPRVRPAVVYAGLTTFVLASTALWFFINLNAMPPYIPGAAPLDPTYAPPEAVAGLAVVASALVLPVSAIACLLTFRIRVRSFRHADRGGAPRPHFGPPPAASS